MFERLITVFVLLFVGTVAGAAQANSTGTAPKSASSVKLFDAARLELHMEYSAYVDGHQSFVDNRAKIDAVFPLGLAFAWGLVHGPYVFGFRTSVYGVIDVFHSSMFAEYDVPLHARFTLPIQVGAGVIYASDDTLVPLMSDTHISSAIHLLSGLTMKVAKYWALMATLSLHAFPQFQTFTYPVGLDLRWSLGIFYQPAVQVF